MNGSKLKSSIKTKKAKIKRNQYVLKDGFWNRRGLEVMEKLKQREIDIIQAIARGDNTNSIAQDMRLTYNTVETYIKTILLKMNVSNRAQLVYEALKKGVIE